MDFAGIASIITAVGAIVLGWLQFLQYGKNKLIDYKIAEMERKAETKRQSEKDAIGRIYGYMWNLLTSIDADRVVIIQPHPPHDKHLISATMEVRNNRTSSAESHIRDIEMGDIGGFIGDISKRQFIYYPDIKACKDTHIRAIMDVSGVHSMAIYRLEDSDGRWCGSLCIDWTYQREDFKIEYIKVKMADAANSIQHILPEYG